MKDNCINVRVYASYILHTKLIHFLSVLQLKENPFHYDSHLQLIELLRQLGDLDRARQARQNMSNNFPLSEGIQNTHTSHPHPHTPHTPTYLTHLNYLLLLLTPLTPSHLTHPHTSHTVTELWLQWIRDELPLCSLPEAALQLRILFETAVEDYLCKYVITLNLMIVRCYTRH